MSGFVDFGGVLSRWFGVPPGDVRSGNLGDLMCYGFLYKTRCAGEEGAREAGL